MKKVLIVGAGLSGCTIARLLKDTGLFDVLMIEKSSSIGGNCKDYIDEFGNLISEHGPHIFHTNEEKIIDFISSFSDLHKGFNHKVKALVNIEPFTNYPHLDFSKLNFYTQIPLSLSSIKHFISSVYNLELAEDIENFLVEMKKDDRKTLTLGDLHILKNGEAEILYKTLYDYIYNPYTCKQWGVNSLYEVSKEVLNRIPIYLDYGESYFRTSFQVYPKNGYSSMMTNMTKDISILTNMPFKNFLEIENVSNFDYIIYTGPIDELFSYSLGRLPYRGVYFKSIYDSSKNLSISDDAFVINYPSLKFKFTRISNYKFLNYIIRPNAKHSRAPIIEEYPVKALEDNRSYPIRSLSNDSVYSSYLELAKSKYPNMKFLGRLGTYKYLNMDEAIIQAMSLFNELIGDSKDVY